MANTNEILTNVLQLLDKKHEMMIDYTPISEEIPDNGSRLFRPKKEFSENGELKKVMIDIIYALNEINSLPKNQCEAIKRKIAHHERNLKYKK